MVRARMRDGSFKFVQLISIDATTFAGAPKEITQGKLDDLRLPNTYGAKKLSRDPAKPISVGRYLRDQRSRSPRRWHLQISKWRSRAIPNVFTTYDQAVQYAPGTRKMLSCVLAGAQPGEDLAAVARRITQATGLKACNQKRILLDDRLVVHQEDRQSQWAFGATVLLGFVVGLAISSQTFYSFVLEKPPESRRAQGNGCIGRAC